MRFSLWPVAAAVLTTLGCAPAGVRTDFDPEFSFRGARTFAWTDSTPRHRDDLERASPFLERRLRRAVENALEDRGYRIESGGRRADLLISAFVVGPGRDDAPWRFWAANRCPGAPHLTIGFGYPFGFSRRFPWYRYRDFYRWDPWGYACAYRIGFGYVWLPIYDRPSDRMPGTLVVDILDPRNSELVWRGWAEGALYDYDAARSQAEIDAAVARVLAEFPPGGRPPD